MELEERFLNGTKGKRWLWNRRANGATSQKRVDIVSMPGAGEEVLDIQLGTTKRAIGCRLDSAAELLELGSHGSPFPCSGVGVRQVDHVLMVVDSLCGEERRWR